MKLRQNDLVWRQIDGETVLLDLVSSSYLSTNKTGTFLLELLVEDHARDTLVHALSERFEISVDAASADTDAFLSELREQNLLG